jgi:hypothetical protein
MDSSLATLLIPPRSDSALEFWTWPRGDRFAFDDAEYDETSDRLRLTCGPPTVASAELTPEGHVVRVSALDGDICGLVLVDVHDRLERHGRLSVTLGPNQHVTLSAEDIVSLISRAVVRQRTRRFSRAA